MVRSHVHVHVHRSLSSAPHRNLRSSHTHTNRSDQSSRTVDSIALFVLGQLMPGGRTASSAARPSKQSSVAALKGVLADPTRAPSPASKRRPQQQPSTDATAGQPKESSVDVAKMRRAQQPTRPPPAPEYVARVSSTAAERKVGSVDSAKGRPPPPAPPPHRAVDVEELCNSLNVTLADRVPASRSRFKKKAAKPPGSIDLLWSALRPEDSGAEGDAESGVDVWETSPGEKWTRAGLCGALVSSFFVGIGQPPCAAVKLVCLWPCCLVLTWAYVVLPLPLGPFASYAALALGVLAVIAQSFTVSFPLAAGFSRISTDLANMLDAAFAEQDAKLTAWTQRKVASLSLPPSIEPKVARVLSRPPAVALGFVRKLIPDVSAPWQAFPTRSASSLRRPAPSRLLGFVVSRPMRA